MWDISRVWGSLEVRHFSVKHTKACVVRVSNREAVLQAAGIYLWLPAASWPLRLQEFKFLSCCQKWYCDYWACGCCWDWIAFSLIYLVTPPSSGGVYETKRNKKKQPISKQQKKHLACLPVSVAHSWLLSQLVTSFSGSAQSHNDATYPQLNKNVVLKLVIVLKISSECHRKTSLLPCWNYGECVSTHEM